VLVAVSGGADSVACLLILLRLRERFTFDVVAAHFDHQLRAESQADMQFVRELCGRLGVPCFTGEGDVAGVAAQQRAGIEETARRMRYQFLAFIAGKERADCVATGHTADDQAETVLMRVIRGSGVRGIRGMLPLADVPGAPAQRLTRPLLVVGRQDTEAICREWGIVPLIDPSNVDVSLIRNRVRHETLPALRALNPSIEDALLGLAASAGEVFAGVERQALGTQPKSRGPEGAVVALEAMAALPNEAVTLVVEREAAFYSLGVELNRTRVENLRSVLGRGSGEVRFGEAVVEVSCAQVRIGGPLAPPEPFETKVLNVPGVTVAGPWRVEVSTDPLAPIPGTLPATVAVARLKGALRVRPLAPGDRMVFHGLDRKVADVLANAKIPRWERRSIVALADGAGVVALVGGPGEPAAEGDADDRLYVRVLPVKAAGAH